MWVLVCITEVEYCKKYICMYMGHIIDILLIPESSFSCESLQGSDITLKRMWIARAYFYTEGKSVWLLFQVNTINCKLDGGCQ